MIDHLTLPGVDVSRRVSEERDCWMTPGWLACKFAAWADIAGRHVLEPCAGTGNLVRALYNHGASRVSACEINVDFARRIEGCREADFLSTDPSSWDVDIVVMNPPFSLACEFISHSLRIAPRVCAILPSDAWSTPSRARLWREVARPTRIAFLAERPRFEGSKDMSPGTNFMFVCAIRRTEHEVPIATPTMEWI